MPRPCPAYISDTDDEDRDRYLVCKLLSLVYVDDITGVLHFVAQCKKIGEKAIMQPSSLGSHSSPKPRTKGKSSSVNYYSPDFLVGIKIVTVSAPMQPLRFP